MTTRVFLHQLSVTSSQQKETLDIESNCTSQNQSLSDSGLMQTMILISFDGKRVLWLPVLKVRWQVRLIYNCMFGSECNSKYSNLLSTGAYVLFVYCSRLGKVHAQLVCYSRLDKVLKVHCRLGRQSTICHKLSQQSWQFSLGGEWIALEKQGEPVFKTITHTATDIWIKYIE